MDCRFNRWKRVAAGFAAGGCMLLGPAACHHRRPPNPPLPNVDALRESLQRTASAAFPSPTLVNRHFALAVKDDEISVKASEISRIASELKGTVLAGPASSSGASLLIRLPGNQVAEFATRALGKALPFEESSDVPVLVEVVLSPKPE